MAGDEDGEDMAKAKKLPSGSWRVQVSTGKKNENGRYIYESITAPTEKEASYLALQYELKLKNLSHNKTNMTLNEAITQYIDMKDGVLSPATIAGYKRQQRNCLQGLSELPLNKLNHENIQREINEMAKKKSPKYVRNAHGLLSAVLNVFYPDFTLKTTLPQKRVYEASIPSSSEIIKIIQSVQDTSIELPVMLALWLGMRMSEIRGLEWSSIKGDIIHIKQAMVDVDNVPTIKGTKSMAGNRKIKMHPYIIALVDKQPKDGKYIIPLSGQTIYKRFSNLCEKNNLPHYRFHDLRHTNASIMLALNVPDKYAMKRGGWATQHTMKNVYQHIIDETENVVDNLINNYFDNLLSHELSHEK